MTKLGGPHAADVEQTPAAPAGCHFNMSGEFACLVQQLGGILLQLCRQDFRGQAQLGVCCPARRRCDGFGRGDNVPQAVHLAGQFFGVIIR